MDCYFYTFSKRPNSTKLPPAGTQKEVQLKAPTSVISPKISISMQSGNPTAWNYCNLPDFGRMYFIRDWTYNPGGVWVATLSEDVLASWKEQIGECTEYVTRSAAQSNPLVCDTLYPTTAQVTTTTIRASTTPFTDNTEDLGKGFFVVAVNAPGYVSFGGCVFMAMSGATFSALIAALLSDTDYLNIDATEISSNLTKALFNPIQYISKAFWMPLGNAAIGTPINQIPVGWWKLNDIGNAYIIASNNDKQEFAFSIQTPHHPQNSRGAYTDGSPYSEYTLYCPPFGQIKLPANLFVGKTTLYCRLTVDYYTGDAVLDVSFDSGFSSIIYSTSGGISVPVQIAQIATNVDELASVGGLLQTTVGAIAGAINSFLTGGDIVNGIASGAQQTTVESQSKGGYASVAKYGITPYLTGAFYTIVDDNNEDHGRPLCKRVKISSIPGYIMVSDADISLPATQAELDSIKSYMERGFFYE